MIAALRRVLSVVYDVVLYGGIMLGLVLSFLTPDTVAEIVTVRDSGGEVQWVVVAMLAVLLFTLVFRFAVTWGPVRVSPEKARWRLSGPRGRDEALAVTLIRPSVWLVVIGALAGGLTALVMPDIAAAPIIAGPSAAAGGMLAAFMAQTLHDRKVGTVRRPWSPHPSRLHRRTFAPGDGYASALELATKLMDLSWIDHARITRWQARRTHARSVTAGMSPFVVAFRLDLARAARHPEWWGRFAAAVAVGVAVPLLFTVHAAAGAVPVVAVYLAGVTFCGGLRLLSESPVLRRSFGISDRSLILSHCAVPAAATVAAAVAVGAAWQLGSTEMAVLVVGSVAAVLRRGTRGPLPYDSVSVIEPALGAAVQPGVLATMARGPLAAVVTATVLSVAV
ncbi:DUF6297 family protein [Gordonia shandongensis]|uniref:DUF6297 family protein n=1 Tax=Gordonia shandongensis TaxID=376351 RepID=UPI00047A01C2|nr:DUF6297 family protein [Gordonia shandongensis]